METLRTQGQKASTLSVDLLKARLSARVGASGTQSGRSQTGISQAGISDAVKARIINDTVNLSGSGQKIVNLARGSDLANDIRNAAVDDGFSGKLARALEDVFRIGRLFMESAKVSFRSWR